MGVGIEGLLRKINIVFSKVAFADPRSPIVMLVLDTSFHETSQSGENPYGPSCQARGCQWFFAGHTCHIQVGHPGLVFQTIRDDSFSLGSPTPS